MRPRGDPVSTTVALAAEPDALPAPGPEQALRELDDVLIAQVAADHQCGPGRVEEAGVCTPKVGRGQPFDRLTDPARRAMVGRRRGVDRADEGLVNASARVGLRLEQVVQPLVAKALHLVLGKGRSEQDLGRQLQGRRQALRGHVHADRQGVPAGIGMQRRPEPLGRLDQGDRVVHLGALGQGTRGKDRRTRLVRRFLGHAAGQDQRCRDEGRPGRSTTRTDRPFDSRSPWTDGNSYDRGAPGFGRSATTGPSRPGSVSRHAATSASSAAAVGSSVGSATSSAVKPSGR